MISDIVPAGSRSKNMKLPVGGSPSECQAWRDRPARDFLDLRYLEISDHSEKSSASIIPMIFSRINVKVFNCLVIQPQNKVI